MSDHNWVLENLESYSAGGLDAQERERLEAHLPECESCSQALHDIRTADQQLESLFAPVRPKPGFEDRMIFSLRMASTKNGFRMPMIGWIGASAAAAVVVGVVGASMERVVLHGNLFPEIGESSSKNDLHQIGLPLHDLRDQEGGEEKYQEPSKARSIKRIGGMARAPAGGSSGPWGGSFSGGGSFGGGGGSFGGGGGSFGGGSSSGLQIQGGTTINNGVFQMLSVGGGGETAQPVDKMAEILSEQHLSKLAKGEANSDGRTPLASVKDGTSNTMMLGEKPVSEFSKPAIAVDQRAQVTSKSEPAEEKKPALREENAPAPRDIYTYRNDQPAATPQATAGAVPPATGWGYSLGGMGGGGRMTGGITAPRAAAPGKGEGKSDNTYYRPGEQAAAELDKYKNKGDKKSEVSQEKLGKGEGKPAIDFAPAEQVPLGALQKPTKIETPPAAMRKIIIRSGEIEFEVDSFDSAVATVTLLVNKLPGAFVATVNSEKLPNGKVRGSMVVRTPPEHLDSLVLDLRKELGKNGELKGQKIGSQDITKQYTDTESRLRAARAMENRLIEIIKSGKGEIKDLLAAEKELGIWRTKIEEYEGEKRYYDNQVALSTLTIVLAEKEIRSPFALIETERVQMGVEVEDVIKAQQAVLKAIDDVKGRVTKSELKQHAADQLSATINFEVAPEKAGAMRDRIEQLGRRTRLDVDRLQETEGGSGEPGRISPRSEIKTRRKETQFFLNIYNVANVAPRETVNLNLACVDTEDSYKKILARVEKATGRVVSSNLNRQRNDQTTGLVQFEVKSADAEAVLMDVRELGEVMRLQTTENPDVQNATRSKRGFVVQLYALGTVAPRETATIQLASKDVPAGYRALLDAINKAKGRVLNSQLNEQDKQNITANLDFEVRRADEAAISKAMGDVGDTYSRTVARAQDSDTVVDSKVRYTVTLINQARIPPRETVTLGIEVNDVDKTAADFAAHVAAVNGRTAEQHVARERSGRMTAKLIYDVPLATARDLVEKFSKAGIVRVQQFSKNQQVPESDLAIARLDVTLSNSPFIVPSDEGFSTELRKGLATSVKVLSLSLSWLVFGLLVILPWVLVVYAIYRLVVRLRGKPSPA